MKIPDFVFPLGFGAALLMAGAPHAVAQNFSTDVNITSAGTALPNLKVQGNGGVLLNGTGGTTGTIPATGAGTRVMWYPAKSAFVAGTVNGTQWNSIGTGTAIFGANNSVPGDSGFAAGSGNSVSGGWNSTALGINNAVSNSSASTVIGQGNLINGGYNSFATGVGNSVSGASAMAIGESNTSSGWTALTVGRGLTSAAAGCVVVGMYNTPIFGNANSWVGAEPVFVVGNGTGGTQLAGQSGATTSNALVVYKDGGIKLGKRQGDLRMGRFGNVGDQ